MSNWIERNGLYVALVAAWTAMLGSLYFSEVAGYLPCELCWYQRILMYPLAGIIAVGVLRRDLQLPFYILPFSGIGILVSTYHYLIQKTDFFGRISSCQEGVPCTTIWINWFGFVTIPFLALTAFMIITIMTLISMNTEVSILDRATSTPWAPVSALVGGTLFVFALLAIIGSQTAVQTSTPIDFTTVASHGAMGSDGELLYRQACGACHGMNMEGVTGLGNSLAMSEFVREQSDEELLAFIRAGRNATDPANTTGLVMPASGGRPDFGDGQLLAIIGHIRAAQGSN